MSAAQLTSDNGRKDDTGQKRQGRAKVSREDRASLGELLREMYTGLQNEPLSPRLKMVLEQLAESQSE